MVLAGMSATFALAGKLKSLRTSRAASRSPGYDGIVDALEWIVEVLGEILLGDWSKPRILQPKPPRPRTVEQQIDDLVKAKRLPQPAMKSSLRFRQFAP